MLGILSKSEKQEKREFILVKRMNPQIPFEQQQIPITLHKKTHKQLLIINMGTKSIASMHMSQQLTTATTS
jgi:hypothetical protein